MGIREASLKHPMRSDAFFTYGTAGFRMDADQLDSVVFRTALLAALRSRKVGGQTIGVMITASHNVYTDNGIKLIDPHGEMLDQSWEGVSTSLANAGTDDEVEHLVNEIMVTQKIDGSVKANVVFARDTRSSGPALVGTLEDGLKAMDVTYKNFGILTTPQLHYLVNSINTYPMCGEPSEEQYFQKLVRAFTNIMHGKQAQNPVYVDCANGVGGPKLRQLAKLIPSDKLEIKVINDEVSNFSKLNHQCGADFVKVQQRGPPGSHLPLNARCASFDGDGDRIVYYFHDTDNKFHLLDGDKIATLAATFIMELVNAAGVDIHVGVVQTAYANGSSTTYLNRVLKVPVTCVPTGVKHLHHEAQRFDCGIYFEANGHGTILFSEHAKTILSTHEAQSPAQQTALTSLKALSELINQTVGDALSDLLLVEAILAHKGWMATQWNGAYNDLPNRLVRVVVKDRSIFKTTDAERKLIEPKGTQDRINELVAKFKDGRAFVRASGTEDAVRVYAEAGTRSEADDLASKVADLLNGM